MKCNFFTYVTSEERTAQLFENFFSRSGEKCDIRQEEMRCIDLGQLNLSDASMWELIQSDECAVIDLRSGYSRMFWLLFARFNSKPENTFFILNKQQSAGLEGGMEYCVCEPMGLDGKALEKQLKLLQRNIAYRFENMEGDYEGARIVFNNYIDRLPEGVVSADKEIDFNMLDSKAEECGDKIIERLKQYMSEADERSFLEELHRLNDNDMIDDMEYRLIARLCRSMNLMFHQLMILKKAYAVWGDKNAKVRFELVDACHESSSRLERERGLALAEEYFHIINGDHGKVFEEGEFSIDYDEDYIKSLFNAYISLGRFEELYQLTYMEDYIIQKADNQKLKPLFARNRAVCLREKGKKKEALQEFRSLYKSMPNQNTISLIADSYEEVGEYKTAYELLEVIAAMSGRGVVVLGHLAEFIYRRDIIRDKDKGVYEVSDISGVAMKAAIPVLMWIFSQENLDNCDDNDLLTIKQTTEKIGDKAASTFLKKHIGKRQYIWTDFTEEMKACGYNFTVVNYIRKLAEDFEKDGHLVDSEVSRILGI